jgi:hypothetical protein
LPRISCGEQVFDGRLAKNGGGGGFRQLGTERWVSKKMIAFGNQLVACYESPP